MSVSHDSSAANQADDGPAAYSAANAFGNFEISVKHVQIVMPKDANLRGRYYCQIKCGEQFFRTGSVDIGGLIQGQQVQPVGVGALAVTLPFDYTCTLHSSPAARHELTLAKGTCAAPSLNTSCVITVLSEMSGSTSTMAWLQTPALLSLFDVVKPPPPKKEEEQVGKQQWSATPQDLTQSAVRARLTRKKGSAAGASAPSSPSAPAAAEQQQQQQQQQQQDAAPAEDAAELPDGWRRLNQSAVAARAALTGRSGSVREGWHVTLTIEEDSLKQNMRKGGVAFSECPWHCGCMVLMGHMEQHMVWCRLAPDPSTAITCSNASVGCSFVGLRPAVAEHVLSCEYTALAAVFAQFAQERRGLSVAITKLDDEVKHLQQEKALLKQTIASAVLAQRAGVPFVITPALECDVGVPGQTMHDFLHLRSLVRARGDRTADSPSSDSEADGNRLEATQVHYMPSKSGTNMRGRAVEEALTNSHGKAFKTTSAGSHFGIESAAEARRPSVEAPQGSSSSLQHWLPSKRVGKIDAHHGGVFCMSIAVLGGDGTDVASFYPAADDGDSGGLRGQTLMFTGGGDGVVKVWSDLNSTPVLQRNLQGHAHGVKCIAAMASTAFSGGQDNSVRIWDVETGSCSGTLLGHSGCLSSLIAYGDLCVSMAADRSMRLWDVRQQRCAQIFDTGSRGNYGMSVYRGSVVSAQGSILFEAELRTMRTHRWQTHPAVSAVNVSAAVGTAAAGQSAAALSSAIERVNLHRKEDSGRKLPSDDYSAAHEQAQTLSAGVGPIGYYTGISSNVAGCGGQILRGDTLYAANVDCSISIWNMPLHCDIKQAALKGHKDFVRDVQSYGAHLFSASDDGCVKCWDPTKLLAAVRVLAPTAFQKAEDELAAQEAHSDLGKSSLGGGPNAPSEDSKLFPRASGEVEEFNLRSQRAKEAAKVALTTVRSGTTMFDVSSLLQRMRLHEGHSVSSAALARSMDKVHDGAFLHCVRQACGRLLVGGSDGVVSLWS